MVKAMRSTKGLFDYKKFSATETLLDMAASVHPIGSDAPHAPPKPFRWFPSFRLLTAVLLCMCYASVHMMNSNMGMAIVCMVNSTEFDDANSTLDADPAAAPKVNWNPDEQGYIFSAFNAGILCMLVTGFLADKLNAKVMIVISVVLASFANVAIPLMAEMNVWFSIGARFVVGFADALIQPAVNSLVTRWFPASERSYALGLATGGRQIGTLLIVPTSGALCSQTLFFGGWPSIFYASAAVGIFFVVLYTIIGADKPSKQNCISEGELRFITQSNSEEDFGKKRNERKVPWLPILKSVPVWAGIISVVCHEFPLMTLIMFLPSYLHDVHRYDSTQNGILSSLPTLSLWVAKIISSYVNTWMQEKTSMSPNAICKVLNAIGSIGLGLFLFLTTLLDASHAWLAVVFLCFSMFWAGFHTPGCQYALVAVAPAFSGAITGLTFFFVALSGIVNPTITKIIVQTGSNMEWNVVFNISTVIALIPVAVFTLWGSAERQSWASPAPKTSTPYSNPIPPLAIEWSEKPQEKTTESIQTIA
ncbi:hypothetical protein QR680_005414 [Steinernema hermaphroditum]|uniref:Major facilitator superfamily (MFS) profile domain-containing protein n=1 Tax=Steinernema hermaphroditum TaxID=289476 RepID=A0AA39HT72_9BILA|nr:hypothetical protein QR680_005414 [Steinernema hermaphroditum]